jgi:hypothetical protein
MKKIIVICIAILALVSAFGATKITLFVIPPIGAIPEGKILVIHRLEKTKFIDSPDAMCERLQGGVSLLCRGVAVATIANNSEILARLPFSNFLYEISTGGKNYER